MLRSKVCILPSLNVITVFHHFICMYFLAGTAADALSNMPNSPPEGENKGMKK